MESPESAAAFPAGSFSGSSSTQESEVHSNESNAREPLDLLEHGYPVVIRIDMKTLLDHVMNSLGSHREPIFSEIDCGDHGVKYSVALDVSGLASVFGELISQSVVVGEAAANRNTAEINAAWKAMNHLHEKHLIKLFDFSSRVAQKLDSYNTYDLFISGLRSVEKIFAIWEVTFAKCEAFAVELENKQFNCNVVGDLSHNSVVFAVPTDCLTYALNDLRLQTCNVRDQMKQLEDDLRSHEKEMSEKMKCSLRQVNPYLTRSLLYSSKQQTALVVMVSKTLEVGEKLKRMWLQLKNEIARQHDLFRLDPTQLISFGMVAAQIDAYKICAHGLADIVEESSTSYQSCAPDFQVLHNLSWHLSSSRLSCICEQVTYFSSETRSSSFRNA